MMEPQPRALAILNVVTAALFLIASGMVFLYAPLEASMGLVQKVFYFHVASAWVGMLGFLVAFIAGIAYLLTSDRKWDNVEVGAVEISLVFFLIAIVSGAIWSRPAWNVPFWKWEPRLTTAMIVELVYAAYMMLRAGIEDPDRRARFGAVYAILGFVSVPLTFFSIRLLQSIHPVLFGGNNPNAQGDAPLTPKMLQTFMFSLFVFSVLFVDLLWHRIRLGKLVEKLDLLKLNLAE
jgi:heme exporter protein C